jgi:hypothetical protein
MAPKSNPQGAERPDAILATGPGESMSAAQAAELKRLSIDAYEPDAFDERLTSRQAEQRIATLRAKLNGLDAPPHTL